jgi:RNA polymerase sigma-70 factor (ECF subfamily)
VPAAVNAAAARAFNRIAMPEYALNRWTGAAGLPTIIDRNRHEGRPLDSTLELERFLASVERRAFVTARIATGNADDALDIVQDAMLALASRYAARPAPEWGALFQTILQSRIRDWYRRSRVRNRFRVWFSNDDEDAGDPMAELPDSAEPGPERRIAQARAMSELEQAIARLPLRQQQAFVLRTWEGLDTRATARAMKCSEGSVKTHYSRACENLRAVLKEYGP